MTDWLKDVNESVGGFVSGVKDKVFDAFNSDNVLNKAVESVLKGPLDYSSSKGSDIGRTSTPSEPSVDTQFSGGGPAQRGGNNDSSMTGTPTPLTPPTAEAPALNEFDPSNLDFEQASVQKQLDMSLEQQLQEANLLFDNSMKVHMEHPAIQSEVTKGRQMAISRIHANYKNSVAQLGSNFAGMRTRAEAEYQETRLNRRRYDLEDEKLGLENQMLKQQASQLLDPQGAELNTQPDMYRSILDKYVEVSGNTEDPAVRAVQQGINLLLDEYALGLASGDAELLGSWQSPYAPVDIQSLLAELDSEDRAPIESLLNEIYRGVVNDYRQAAAS